MDDVHFLVNTQPVDACLFEKCKDPAWIDKVLDGSNAQTPTWAQLERVLHIYQFGCHRRSEARIELERHITHFSAE